MVFPEILIGESDFRIEAFLLTAHLTSKLDLSERSSTDSLKQILLEDQACSQLLRMASGVRAG